MTHILPVSCQHVTGASSWESHSNPRLRHPREAQFLFLDSYLISAAAATAALSAESSVAGGDSTHSEMTNPCYLRPYSEGCGVAVTVKGAIEAYRREGSRFIYIVVP